jgi:cyclic pyranopterin phosphate synthase
MPNLLLTRKCVRRCPYCFADQYMAESASAFLQWGDFVYVLDFYERNDVRVVSMLGGEPTVHPDVASMMDYALQRGFDVRMFTSGVMGREKREALRAVWEAHEGRSVHFIVNVNDPRATEKGELESQLAFLETTGRRGSLSFNIYRPDFDLDFAFEYVARYDLQPTIRLGIAHRIATAARTNAHVDPGQYRQVADRLLHYAPMFDACKVTPGLDCGFPMCMFTDAQLGSLLKLRATFNWTCGPVIDIGPDLGIWPCFPLSHIRSKKLYDFESLPKILEFLAKEIRDRRKGNTGVYVECDECAVRDRELCSGGCVSYCLPEVAQREGNDPVAVRSGAAA